jgi:hypothetical protein
MLNTGLAPARAAGVLLLVLGTLPLCNWIAGGHQAPWYPALARELLLSTVLVAGAAIFLAALSRQWPALWRDGRWTDAAAGWERQGWRADLLLAAVALAGYALVATLVFSRKPLLIDEIIEVYQARMLAGGHLWIATPAYPEFTSSMNVIDDGRRVYGQFPVGGPLMLVPGVFLSIEWLTGPMFGALSVLIFARLMRRVELSPATGLAAVLFFAAAPFVAFMAGSHMNHVTVLTWLLLAALGLAGLGPAPAPSTRSSASIGLALGIAATIRPVDAAAYAIPAAVWLLARTIQVRQRWPELVAACVGVAIPLAFLLWVNGETTGSPLLFAYSTMWGPSQELGFHAAPFGGAHTLLRGIQLLNLYALRLQVYLFEAPIPALLPAAAALMFTTRLSAFDRYLLGATGLLAAGYFAYWSDGFYLGPRFMYPAVPLLVLWTARLGQVTRERGASERVRRSLVYGTIIAVMVAITNDVPRRASEYATDLTKVRWDVDAAARAAGVRNALVFVRESWGSQLMARLWRTGISRPEAERYYHFIDPCILDRTLDAIESSVADANGARDMLRPVMADSLRLVHAGLSPDPTLRALPGTLYGPRCRRRLAEDNSGFLVYPPMLLAGRDGNTFVRDLHSRDTLLLATAGDRPLYLLTADQGSEVSGLVFEPLDRDSALAEWRAAP